MNSAREGLDKPMIAAVANAIHDATGVRLRRPPFRKARGLAALRAAAAQTEVQAHRQADAFHSYAARL